MYWRYAKPDFDSGLQFPVGLTGVVLHSLVVALGIALLAPLVAALFGANYLHVDAQRRADDYRKCVMHTVMRNKRVGGYHMNTPESGPY